MLAAKHFDPVMGVDIHIVTIPPAGPVPIPHPHISSVLDPMDYVPIMGGTVLIGGVPRGTAGTAGTTIPHIPLGGPFVKPAGNEDEIFMGSATVLADGAPFTFTALPALSCQDVGMPAPVRAKKPKKSYGMLLPTSSVITIPAGLPVMVGGPPTVDMMGLAMSGAFAALGAMAKKLRKLQKGSKRIKKISDAIHKKAKKLMDKLGVPPNVQNKVHKGICSLTGHPVDVATGKVISEALDFELPGPIPFTWGRTYMSCLSYKGILGRGWIHNYDCALIEENRAVAIRLNDGRAVAFPALKEGESSFSRQERLTLFRSKSDYILSNTKGENFHFTAKNDSDYFLLSAISNDSYTDQIRFYYDRGLRLSKVEDSAARTIIFEYDSENRLSKISLPNPEDPGTAFCFREYSYFDGQLSEVRDSKGNSDRFSYSGHLLTSEKRRNGTEFFFDYDCDSLNARCIKTWGTNGLYHRTLEYGQEYTRVTDSRGHTTQFIHDGAVTTKIVDACGGVTTTTYNEFYEVICCTDQLGRTTSFQYDRTGNQITTLFPNGNSINLVYDQTSNVTAAKDVNGGEWQWHFDSQNQLSEFLDPTGAQTRFFYERGQLVALKDSENNIVRFQYDRSNNLHKVLVSESECYTYHYDALGRMVCSVDALGGKRTIEYDTENHIKKIHEPDGNIRVYTHDAEGNVLSYSDQQTEALYGYTGLGKLAWKSVGGEIVRLQYDSEENLVAIQNHSGERHLFAYDQEGRLCAEQGFDRVGHQYHYDLGGQLIAMFVNQRPHARFDRDISGNISRAQYADGAVTEYTFGADGNLLKAVNQHSVVEFQRDALGKILNETVNGYSVMSTYDNLGRLTKLSSGVTGQEIEYQYDFLGRTRQIEIGVGSGRKIHYQRDCMGQETSRMMPGGITVNWDRDLIGRIESQSVSSTHDMAQRYIWGANDRLQALIDPFQRQTEYSYDKKGRLQSSRHASGYSNGRFYDKAGNVYRLPGLKDRKYDLGGRLVTLSDNNCTVQYQYSDVGNRLSETGTDGRTVRYQWSTSGDLQSVKDNTGRDVRFEYDALGRRIRKITESYTVHTVWHGNQVLHEWASPNENGDNLLAYKSRLMGTERKPVTWITELENNTLVARLQGNDFHSVLCNLLGSPTRLFDEEGHSVWALEMDDFGKPLSQQGESALCPFRFPGQYYDVETGLHYNRYRYYDPNTGGFISRDRIGIEGGINLYGYVNNPVSWFDYFGLHEVLAWLDGEPVTNSKGGHSWYSDWGSSKAPFNGYGAQGHSEAKLLEHLDKTQSGNLKGKKLTIVSMGQITKGGKKTLSPLASCPPCAQGLEAFAKKHEMDIEYIWDEKAGDKGKKVYKGCS